MHQQMPFQAQLCDLPFRGSFFCSHSGGDPALRVRFVPTMNPCREWAFGSGISKNGNPVYSVKGNGMPTSFVQKIGHSR